MTMTNEVKTVLGKPMVSQIMEDGGTITAGSLILA